ncbi:MULTISPECIES: TetR/AcrR family transcriptional regulator [Dysgonomonas]|uniref:TetR/AcrR family transcriptional regulator n=1 Tax=Dysgonomonas TaxID=156973 RepID=UPI00291C8164|nr:TetR/AcrR family transcriptional regulator [Dysgonomonas capnocytophagoides]
MSIKETDSEKLILEAAEAEFIEKGYGKSRTTEIAKRAGVNHAMLHYYFRTKENLFEVVFKKKAKLMSEVLLFSFTMDLPFLEKIKKGIEDHFDLLAKNPGLPNFIFNEIAHDDRLRTLFVNVIKEKANAIRDSLKQEIDNEVEKGTIRYIDAYDLLFSIVSLNIFVFIGKPLVLGILELDEDQFLRFLEHRKQVNVEIILNRLQM